MPRLMVRPFWICTLYTAHILYVFEHQDKRKALQSEVPANMGGAGARDWPVKRDTRGRVPKTLATGSNPNAGRASPPPNKRVDDGLAQADHGHIVIPDVDIRRPP